MAVANVSPDRKIRALQRDSVFTWSNRVSLAKHLPPNGGAFGHDDIMLSIQQGRFTDKDFFILKCLYQIGVVNIEGLTNFVLSKIRGQRPLERCMTPEEATYEYIKKRLESYAVQGLVGHFRYKIEGQSVDLNDSKYLSTFFVTYEGYTAIKAHFRMPDYYYFDSDLIYLSTFEVFQRVAVKRCCTAFARRHEKVNIFGEYTIPLKKEMNALDGKNVKWRYEKVYSYATVENEDGKVKKVYLEPMFYNVDPKTCSNEDNIRHNMTRLGVLREIVENGVASGEDAYLVIVVENIAGLRKFVDMIQSEPDFTFYKERCFFTSDTVVCELMREDVDGALLKMVVEDKKIKFVSERVLDAEK